MSSRSQESRQPHECIEEPETEVLEAQFPPASGVAFSDARERVLASGQSVLESRDGAIYEVTPDGHLIFVRMIDPPVDVTRGRRIELP